MRSLPDFLFRRRRSGRPSSLQILTDPWPSVGGEDAIAGRPERVTWWLLPNLFALDAPLVAVTWLLALGQAFGSPPELAVILTLFASVWTIYLGDRLLDVHRQRDWQRATFRHRFARRHLRFFVALFCLALLLAGGTALTQLPADLLRVGLGLGLFVALYFLAFGRWFPEFGPLPAKELACGLVFGLGCGIGVEAVRLHPLEALPAVALLSLVCVFNCLAISAWEKAADEANDLAAASRWWPGLDRDLHAFGIALMLLSYAGYRELAPSWLYASLFASSFALLGLHLARRAIPPRPARVLADAVLLSPLPALLAV